MEENRRLRLGIIFKFNPSWMGGIIYILNLIKTFDFLDDKEKPEILLFYNPNLEKFISRINYPYLTVIKWSFPSIIKGNILSFLTRKNVFVDKILSNYDLDVLYPLHDFPVKTKSSVRLIHWCADLQYKYYPEFFPKWKIIVKNMRIKLALNNNNNTIVSSQSVLDDFKRFFKIRKDLNIHIYHFVSIIDKWDEININDLREKYSLPEKYFFVSNQFHKHKNHKVLLQTLVKLKAKNKKIHLAITGKLPEAENSTYLADLHKLIDENSLQKNISILGFIPRDDQLQLMRYSQAVIQPSLFEGWSTVIEDSRSLQVPVIASNLKVNKEQLKKTGIYFDPSDPDELASILTKYPERKLNEKIYEDYELRVKKAATKLIEIFKNSDIN